LKAGDFASEQTLREYVEHDVSNFVVQCLLATTRDPKHFEDILVALAPSITSGYIVDKSNKRRGVLFRTVEASVKHDVKEKELLGLIVKGFQSLQGENHQCHGLADCIPMLLDVIPAENDGDRPWIDASGARTIHYLLKFNPDLCKDTLKGILRHSVSDLEMLAKDGLGSRCVWDGILDGPSSKSPVFASAITKLFSKLRGRWIALASDRVGHHVVKKLFRSLPGMDAKQQLVIELIEGKTRLNGCAMGRSVMDACNVEVFVSSGEKEWSRTVSKMLEKGEWLNEIVDKGPSRRSFDAVNNGKKRKGGPNGGKATPSVVESILETLKVPSQKKPHK